MDNASRPRLLIVAPSAYPLGGVATWLDGLAAGLRARGWQLEVGLLSGRHHDVDRYLERHPLGPVRRIESRSGSREGRLRSLERAIVASEAEMVLSVNVGDIEDAFDRMRARRSAVPRLVTTQHGLQSDFYEHLRERAVAVDGVVATNRLAVELVCRFAAVERERVAYAPYGVEVGRAPAPRVPAAKLRVAWVGRLERGQKRAEDLEAVSRKLAAREIDFLLSIAGSGPEEERLRSSLAELVARGCVSFEGELSGAELRRVYQSHDALLVTSGWETGPIVAWEALAAGAAVVSSAFVGSGLERALRHDETALLFPIGAIDAAADQLTRLLEPEVRDRLAAAGRAEVDRRYSLAASLDAWEAALLRFALVGAAPGRERIVVQASGRLDRLLGPAPAESVRELLDLRHSQSTPGAEWPHALVPNRERPEFLDLARELDQARAGEAERDA